MLEWLSRTKLDTREVLRKISNRTLEKNHFVIRLRTKERELAVAPRCYGMLTIEMRTYFVLTEKNIANSLFSFCRLSNYDVIRSKGLSAVVVS